MPNTNPFPIIDGHNDTLLKLYRSASENGRSFFERSDEGHLDLPRAREGGLAGGFFAVFVPNKQEGDVEDEKKHITKNTEDEFAYDFPLPPPLKHKYALRQTTAVASLLYRIEAESDGQVKQVRTVADLQECLHEGALAAILHFEGAETIDRNLDALHIFHGAGLRSLGLVWSRPNKFAHGVPFTYPASPNTGPGLTDLGQKLVRECNQLGILVDLSHLNEKGFWDVAKITDAPLVATHSNAHALCPSSRNLTDRQLDAIGESGGIVGINFNAGFLRADGRNDKNTPLTDIVRHIDYVADRIGIDHVGFGSDFDGATMPAPLKDAAGLPQLITALRDHGYDDDALRRITHENWLRVLRRTWKNES